MEKGKEKEHDQILLQPRPNTYLRTYGVNLPERVNSNRVSSLFL